MKKKIVLLRIALLVVVLINIHVNLDVDSSDINLVSLVGMSSANAETGDPLSCAYYGCRPYVWYDCHIYLYGAYIQTCYNMRG